MHLNKHIRHLQPSPSSIRKVRTTVDEESKRYIPSKTLEGRSIQLTAVWSKNLNMSSSLGIEDGSRCKLIDNHMHHIIHPPPQINNGTIEEVRNNVLSPPFEGKLCPSKATRVRGPGIVLSLGVKDGSNGVILNKFKQHIQSQTPQLRKWKQL